MFYTSNSLLFYASPYLNANYTLITLQCMPSLLVVVLWTKRFHSFTPLLLHAYTSLRFYTSMPLHLYASVITPSLHFYASSPLPLCDNCISTLLRLYTCTMLVLYSSNYMLVLFYATDSLNLYASTPLCFYTTLLR